MGKIDRGEIRESSWLREREKAKERERGERRERKGKGERERKGEIKNHLHRCERMQAWRRWSPVSSTSQEMKGEAGKEEGIRKDTINSMLVGSSKALCTAG